MSETFTLAGTTWQGTLFTDEDEQPAYRDYGLFHTLRPLRAKVRKELERVAEGKKPRQKSTKRFVWGASFAYGVTVPDEWAVEHGFGSIHDRYHAGGYWKSSGRPKFHLRHGITKADLVQAYLAWQAGATLRRLEGRDAADQWEWPKAKRYRSLEDVAGMMVAA